MNRKESKPSEYFVNEAKIIHPYKGKAIYRFNDYWDVDPNTYHSAYSTPRTVVLGNGVECEMIMVFKIKLPHDYRKNGPPMGEPIKFSQPKSKKKKGKDGTQ